MEKLQEIDRVRAGDMAGPLVLDVKPSEVDFWRCKAEGCGRLITKLEMRWALDERGGAGLMPCGHRRVVATNIKPWEHIYPRVWWFAILRILRLA